MLAEVAILVVDDDPYEAVLLPFRTRDSRFALRFEFARDFAALDALLPALNPTLILCDNRFPPSIDFRETLPAIRRSGYAGPVVVTSASIDDPCFREAASYGVARVVDKADLDAATLDALIREALAAAGRPPRTA